MANQLLLGGRLECAQLVTHTSTHCACFRGGDYEAMVSRDYPSWEFSSVLDDRIGLFVAATSRVRSSFAKSEAIAPPGQEGWPRH
jgi:hypothetical protein